MTQQLEDLFNLPEATNVGGSIKQADSVKIDKEHQEQTLDQQATIKVLDTTSDKIDAALPSVRDIATSDSELDTLADMATEQFKELMVLGMNVEPRFGSEIFSTAATMLGHAITAKSTKINNKMKIVQLQIQKARLDQQQQKLDADLDSDEPEEGKAQELDRNALLAQILEQSNSTKKDK